MSTNNLKSLVEGIKKLTIVKIIAVKVKIIVVFNFEYLWIKYVLAINSNRMKSIIVLNKTNK